MRRVIVTAVGTIVGLIMLLSFKTRSAPQATVAIGPSTGAPITTSPTTSAPTANGPTSPTTPATSGTPGATSGSASPTTGAPVTKTVTGSAASTRYGPVQVQITLTGGQVTAVRAVVYPTGSSRDQEINSFAIPQLNQEALAAKSAQIDMVSGATYTSSGYITSLQSALSKAGVA
jgi:uncharacterized protein with FMN-binding domain